MNTLLFALLLLGPSARAAGPGPLETFDDAAVAAFVRAANETQAGAGRVAAHRARSEELELYARRTTYEHEGSNEDLAAELKRMGLKAKSNAGTRLLREAAESEVQAVSHRRGADFDAAYVLQQVEAHRALLENLERALASPERRDDRFAAYLMKVRELEAAHLAEARDLSR